MSLTSLPTEVLYDIGRLLEQEVSPHDTWSRFDDRVAVWLELTGILRVSLQDVCTFNQVNRRIHAAITPLLFQVLKMRFEVYDTAWICDALEAVRPSSWKNIQEVEMTVFVPPDRQYLEWCSGSIGPSELQKRHNLWHTLFGYLGPLARLSIAIGDGSQSAETVLDILQSPHWFDYTCLVPGFHQVPSPGLRTGLLPPE